jgi:hypothetical protein
LEIKENEEFKKRYGTYSRFPENIFPTTVVNLVYKDDATGVELTASEANVGPFIIKGAWIGPDVRTVFNI